MASQAFYGFERGEAEHRLKKVKGKPDRAMPALLDLIDTVALPGFTGLYDSMGGRIDEAAATTISRDGRASTRNKLYSKTAEGITLPADLRVEERPMLFGGYLSEHYGHFVIDSMSRLWARDVKATLPILFTTPAKWRELPSLASYILDALRLQHRIVLVEEPTLYRHLICPGTSFEYRWKAFLIADEPHMAVTRATGDAVRTAWRQPVYLTRSGLGDRRRKIDAEPELEEELSKRGFEVVRPETLPLAEQISLFEHAPLVVGTMGSALHTALFSRASGTKLAVLNWGRGFENCLLVDAVKQHKSYYLKSMERRGDAGEHVLDVGLTLKLIDEAGLMP